jgi:(1->4)-alpha-D-glucan 1-alpha-D-glucosylmutase
VIATIPRATARLQLHRGFTLDDAAATVPYLAQLGISHLYISPLLTARPGSLHGYDIVDHGAVNPELGGEAALRRLMAALRGHAMGLLADIVPNHMGVGGADNAWWLDLLEWGRASPYASFFDIDWEPPDRRLLNKVMVPFLGAPYGVCLANGEIRLGLAAGRLAATYAEHVFPIAPRDYRAILGELLPRDADALRRPAQGPAGVCRALAALDGDPRIADTLARFDPAQPDGQARLHALLERQNYRLAWWRAAADEINWRRFFDVTSLAGLRVELPAVFEATHATILRLYGDGLIDGVRIDHVDGLADPRAYCRKLRRRLAAAGRARPPGSAEGEPYIVVEKILAHSERLPPDWQTDGTTGYDFMDQVGAVLHDAGGERPLTAMWSRLSGRPAGFAEVEERARRLTLRDTLASELNAAAAALHRVARRDLATRDYSLTAIRRALIEILVHFPVYRLYAGLAGRSGADGQMLARAIAGARRTMRRADHPLLDLVADWLGGASGRALPIGAARRARLRGIVAFEQLSSPVAAKSVEDTAFYRYGRLLSRNEVGSDPGILALGPAAFHAACAARRRDFPAALLATATHDHKRGEDVRARLAVLSEIPDEWDARVQRWMRLNAMQRRALDDGPAPRPADELMLYQTLVGAWPPGLSPDDAAGLAGFIGRVGGWQVKALREAKLDSAWIAPNEAYEAACAGFLRHVLAPPRPTGFAHDIAAFVDRIAPSGAVNGLAQTVLRLTTPGVPDLYQGTEFWDFSLVDPDNRREVDFAARAQALAAGAPGLEAWRSGAVKQAVIARLLALRARLAALFAAGRYVPLKVEGPHGGHVLAFARERDGVRAVVAVTRLPASLLGNRGIPLVPPARWAGTRLVLPRNWSVVRWENVLADGAVSSLALGQVFATLPVAVLVSAG